MGDAAHPVTPAGGQGANMSIADAVVLADVIDDALAHHDVSAARLQAYETIRRPANARSLQISQRAASVIRLLRAAPALSRLLEWTLIRVDHSPTTKDRLVNTVSRTFLSGDHALSPPRSDAPTGSAV